MLSKILFLLYRKMFSMEKRSSIKGFDGKRALIMDWLLKKIYAGVFTPGSRIPSRNSLAKNFNSSYATVDYVMRKLIQDGFLVAEHGKGTYVAEYKTRSIKDAIAIVNCNAVFSWSGEIEQWLLSGLGENTRTTLYSIFDLRISANWIACKKHKVIVFILAEAHHSNYLEELRYLHTPHLVLYRDPPESSFINIDHRVAGKALVAVLKARGCKKIAWVSRLESRYKTPEQRFEGYLLGLLEQGLEFRQEWAQFYPFDKEKEYLSSLLACTVKPDALIIAQADMNKVIEEVYTAGLVPGKDILLACMDEVSQGQYPFPVLCLEKMTREIGEAAAKILLNDENIFKENLFQKYLTPQVIER